MSTKKILNYFLSQELKNKMNAIMHEKCIFYKKFKTDMMKNNLCITTLLLCLHFNFP